MRWPRWWTGSISTAHSGVTGLTVSKYFWKGWIHDPGINDQYSRKYSYPCDREGIRTPASEAVARAHREPAHCAMDDEQRLRAGARAEVPIPGRPHAKLEWCCRLRGADRRPIATS